MIREKTYRQRMEGAVDIVRTVFIEKALAYGYRAGYGDAVSGDDSWPVLREQFDAALRDPESWIS